MPAAVKDSATGRGENEDLVVTIAVDVLAAKGWLEEEPDDALIAALHRLYRGLSRVRAKSAVALVIPRRSRSDLDRSLRAASRSRSSAPCICSGASGGCGHGRRASTRAGLRSNEAGRPGFSSTRARTRAATALDARRASQRAGRRLPPFAPGTARAAGRAVRSTRSRRRYPTAAAQPRRYRTTPARRAGRPGPWRPHSRAQARSG